MIKLFYESNGQLEHPVNDTQAYFCHLKLDIIKDQWGVLDLITASASKKTHY